MAPQLSVIIPTYNRLDILKETYSSVLKASKNMDVEVIIVNDDKRISIAVIEDYLSIDFNTAVVNSSGKGAASARNTGCDNARADLLLFIDDDILISAENLASVLNIYKSGNAYSCYNFNWILTAEILDDLKSSQFGRFLIANDLTSYRGWVKDLNWKSEEQFIPVKKLAAFFFTIKKDLFLKSGGFNENFKNQGVEDDELSLRLINIGCKLFIKQNEYVLHNEKDKQELLARLQRICNGTLNKRIAVDMGMSEHAIYFSPLKAQIIKLLSYFRHALLKIALKIPNKYFFDKFYFIVVNSLISIGVYNAYAKKKLVY